MADAHANFAVSAVATAPSPASSGTSLVVTAAQGAYFPTAPFNATVCPAATNPTPTNAEIVRVTNASTDTFTITRAQESTSARSIIVGDQIYAAVTAKTLTDVEYSRGAVSIAGAETRTNTAYGTLTTPDQVTGIVLPTNGLIAVAYQALWQESVQGATRADIFIGANELMVGQANGAPTINPTSANGSVNKYAPIATVPGTGLVSPAPTAIDSSDVTTGQMIGVLVLGGGPIYLFAAAGTYTVSIQFKSSSGSVTVKNRHLWVWAQPLG